MSSDDNPVLLSDLQLARMAGRDRKTAENVLRRLQPKIFQVVRSVVRSDAEATEMGQMVALEVLESLRNFRGEGTLEAWAGGLAYRVTMRALKKSTEWKQMHVSIREGDDEVAGNPEKEVSRQQLFHSLSEKLQDMPKKRRTPILLHLLYGYSVAEVSDIMGVSPNTTKDRLKTALRELRAVFDRNPGLREAMLEVMR